ncbi:hypothetical protein [Tropicimonas sp. IMCC6043]|uniref:hypothetical protein n=1 Tax=Tropicimonas sp. IMCC6043 TaxID=2510645 RepID=UPI00101D4376|nr:hypothetical protein [Tropicimonas sp. IMCC6043]RYH08144.1 hypothetical protein EU800_17785 [Tropicimonas sp. IMCC6043]
MRSVLLLALFLTGALPAQAAAIGAVLPGASERGTAVYRHFGFPIYEARLYTRGGGAFDWNDEFGLELRYLRNLSQYDLVEGTMRELARTGGALPVRNQLESCYSKVSKGDRYLAVTDGPNRISLWLNGRPACTLSHPEIKYRFMAIFLGENTRSQSFTRRLKGQ